MANVLTVPNSGIISFDSRAYSNLTVPPLSTSARIGYDGGGGINITSYTTAATALDRFSVDGTQGRLFSVTDSLTGTLFSVNNITGLPILEVQDTDTVIAGQYNTNAFVLSGTRLGLGTRPLGTNRLSVSGDVQINDVQIRTKTSNIFIGDSTTGNNNTLGNNNTFIGIGTGTSNISGDDNFFVGLSSGLTNTNGVRNVFIGRNVGCDNTTGSDNVFIGANARKNTTGGRNVFLGRRAGNYNTVGNDNVFFGRYAGFCNTSGSYNNFIGNSAGNGSLSGCSNNFFGRFAGLVNYGGDFNNFFGHNAGRRNTTGSFNVFIGHDAGCVNTTGYKNIVIGYKADVSTANLSGVIVLGNTAIATQSNQIVFSTANVLFRSTGNTFEIGSSTVTNNLAVYGAVNETQTFVTISLSTLNLVLTSASFFVVNLNSSITATNFLNPPATSRAYSFVLQLCSTGVARSVVWPTTVKWPGGSAPVLTTLLTSVDSFTFLTYDGGNNYFGFPSGFDFRR